jgi:hypothetical protein
MYFEEVSEVSFVLIPSEVYDQMKVIYGALNFWSFDWGKQRYVSWIPRPSSELPFALKAPDVEMRAPEECGEPKCNNQSYSMRRAWWTGRLVGQKEHTSCWQARSGGTCRQLPSAWWMGARALPTGSLSRVISSYTVILTTILSLVLVEWYV